MTTAPATAETERTSIGSYRVVRSIGRGGMGVVYEVESTDGRRFALKLFNRVEKNREFLKKRFCVEARLLAKLSHPNLVRVHDAGTDEASGEPYFVMDLVVGATGEPTTLEALRKQGAVSDSDARRYFNEMSGVLDYLARQGVVHRDVKLENILVDAEGHAHLSDFGVARIFDVELKRELAVSTTFVEGESTGSRPVIGTYFYLAPEVRAGKPATAESDLYALGATFFRVLTGMWYEPNANIADMLAPFGRFWRRRLPRLLSSDPSGRRLPPAGRFRRRVLLGALSAAVLAAAGAVAIAAACFAAGSPREMAIDLGAGGEMAFAACPAGSFMMSNIGNETGSVHKVTITHPFWVGKTFVTARQLRAEFPDARRDETAEKMEKTFDGMFVACRMRGRMVDDYIKRLNMRFGEKLPHGYVFRLPTEAELEYAIREGGARPARNPDVWWDARETKRLMGEKALEFHDDLRLLPKSGGNGWGLVSLWTDTEQAVLDTVDGKPGTTTAAAAISYGNEEVDPLRTGSLRLSRQASRQRWLLMKEPSGFARICIGPKLSQEGK